MIKVKSAFLISKEIWFKKKILEAMWSNFYANRLSLYINK